MGVAQEARRQQQAAEGGVKAEAHADPVPQLVADARNRLNYMYGPYLLDLQESERDDPMAPANQVLTLTLSATAPAHQVRGPCV